MTIINQIKRIGIIQMKAIEAEAEAHYLRTHILNAMFRYLNSLSKIKAIVQL